MPGHRIFSTSFASIYPHYVTKVERKGRSRAEVDEVICWLTGYDPAGLREALADERDVETFFARAPSITPTPLSSPGSSAATGSRTSRTR